MGRRIRVCLAVGVCLVLGSGLAYGDPFVDVTGDVGLDAWTPLPDYNDYSVAWGDHDGDGFVDLFIGDLSTNGSLFTNSNGMSFESSSPPVTHPGLFVDYNNDGLPDITTAMAGGHMLPNLGGGNFGYAAIFDAHPWQSECAAWGDFDGDGDLDSYRTGWEPDPYGPYFPDAIFTQTNTNGIHLDRTWWQEDETDANTNAGRGVTIADFDEDGDVDIYVSNYRLLDNFLWLNDGSGSFTNVADTYGVDADPIPCEPPAYDDYYPGGHTIASAWGDLDNDGHLDLLVGNFSHGDACQETPRFYRNMGLAGSWHFEDMSSNAAMPYVQSHASPALGDFDNDGDLDVFITAVSGDDYTGEQSTLMCNDGNWNFTDCSVDYGLNLATPKTNFQAAWADYDNDGDLDLYTGQKLYENPLDNGNNWLMVRIEGNGDGVNSDAIGTQVRIDLGGGTVLTRQVENATGWGNQNDPRLHFGLGTHPDPVDLLIAWPDGWVEVVSGVSVDQVVTVTMPNAPSPPPLKDADDLVVVRGAGATDGLSDWFGTYTDPAPVYIDDPDGGGAGTAPDDTEVSDVGPAGGLTLDVMMGDVDGDGIDDTVIAYTDPNIISGAGDPKVSWMAAHSVDAGGGVGEFSKDTTSGGPTLDGFGGSVGSSVGRFLGDVNGDGADDMIHVNSGFNWRAAISIPGTGLSKDTLSPAAGSHQYGLGGDQPFVGDFNGDGRTDVGVYRIPGGNTFISFTGESSGELGSNGTAQVGQIGGFAGQDSILVANLDGDDDDDLIMVRQTGEGLIWWYGLINSNGAGHFNYFNAGTTLAGFGLDGIDIPMVSDVNGDGMDDIVVWRTTTAQWFALFTTAGGALGTDPAGDESTSFGLTTTGDIPLIAQLHDSPDTQDDLVIYRPPGGWYGSYTRPDPLYWDDDEIPPAPTDTQMSGFGLAEDVFLLGDVDSNGIDDVVAIGQTNPLADGANWLAGHSVVDSNGLGGLSMATSSGLDATDAFAPGATEFFLADVTGNGYDDAIAVVRDPDAVDENGRLYWYVAPSGPEGLGDGGALQEGINNGEYANETPIMGDFNGDGYADKCSITPGFMWYVDRTSNPGGLLGAGGLAVGQFGSPGDIPLVGDINGDGRDDGLVFRDTNISSNGSIMQWFVATADANGKIDFTTGSGGATLPFWTVYLGLEGDTPFVMDINGDGLDDIGVTREDGDHLRHFVTFSTADGLGNNPMGDEIGHYGSVGDLVLVGQLDMAEEAQGCNDPPLDSDGDTDIDLDDYAVFEACFTGPGVAYENGGGYPCECFDSDGSPPHGDLDLVDFAAFQRAFTGAP